jgi:hypothetical protein
LWVQMVTCGSANKVYQEKCRLHNTRSFPFNQRESLSNAGTAMHILTENIQRSDDPSVWSHDKPRWHECALCEFMGLEDTGESTKFCSFGYYECGVHYNLHCFHKHHNRQPPQLRSIQCGNGCSSFAIHTPHTLTAPSHTLTF